MNQYRTVARGVAGAIILSMAAATAAVFPASAQAQSAQLERIIQQERQAAQDLARFQREQIKPLAEELRILRDEERRARSEVQSISADAQERSRDVARARNNLRQLENQEFILNVDLSELAKTFRFFREARTNEAAIEFGQNIFKMLNGPNAQPPRRLNDIEEFVFREEIVFRRKMVAIIGPALVKIGELTTSIVANTRLLKSVGGLQNPGLNDGTYKAVFNITRKWARDIGQPLPGIDQKTAEAKDMAAELQRISNQQLFGNPDGRAAALEAVKRSRSVAEFILAAAEEKLAISQTALQEANAVLDEQSGEADKIEERLEKLREQERDLQQKVADLGQQSLQAQTSNILSQATGRRIAVSARLRVSNPFRSNFGRNNKVAVDDLTAALLDLPRKLSVNTSSTYEVEETVTCQVCQRRSSDSDEVVCRDETARTFRQISLPSDPDARYSTSPGNELRQRDKIVEGREAGQGFIRGRLNSKVASVTTADSPCGRVRVVQSGSPGVETEQHAVEALQVQNIRTVGADDEGRIDLIHVPASFDFEGFSRRTRGGIALRGDVVGASTSIGASLAVRPTLIGNTSGLDITRRDNSSDVAIVARDAGGDVQIAYFIRDESGRQVGRENVQVTSSALTGRIQKPGDNDDRLLALGETASFQIVIDGRASTSGWKVEWEGGQQGVEFSKETSFSGTRSATQVRFTDPKLVGKNFVMRARIKDGEEEIAQIQFPQHEMIIRMRDMRFVLAKSDIGVEAIDFFTPTAPNAFQGIEVQIRDSSRSAIPVAEAFRGRSVLSVRQIGLSVLNVGPNTEMGRTIEGRALASTTEVGSGLLEAIVDVQQAREQGVHFVGSGANTGRLRETVLLTLNRLFVEIQDGPNGQEFVLKSFGPARITGYNAVFNFTGGQTETASFQESAFGGEARVPVNGRNFIRADVARQNGRVVGSVSSALDGRPLPPTTVRLEIPPEGVSGGQVVVRGLIENIAHNDSFDLRCEWEVDPTLGTLRDETTSVSPTGETGGICINALTLSDDPSNVNRDVDIGIRISRQIGAGDPS